MKRIRKVYMPLWIAWFSQAFIMPMWGVLTYQTFFVEEGALSLGVWISITIFFAALSAMLLLMGYRKLPTQIIEEEEK